MDPLGSCLAPPNHPLEGGLSSRPDPAERLSSRAARARWRGAPLTRGRGGGNRLPAEAMEALDGAAGAGEEIKFCWDPAKVD
jgi:hypothetical protein